VRIDENVRLMNELHARWEREEIAKKNSTTKVYTITTTNDANVPNDSKPPIISSRRAIEEKVSTSVEKLPKIAKTVKTASDKSAEIFRHEKETCPVVYDSNAFDFYSCNITEVIKFLQKLAESPNASAINMAFTKHITNVLMQAREEKLKREASIPRKLDDCLEPIIKVKVNEFDCNALCDLGCRTSIMPKKLYDMLDLPPMEDYYDHPADTTRKKPLGRINDVLIMVNNNLVPVDFTVLDIGYNASCPIILGRSFLKTVGAVIDMKEGTIKYQFPLKKGMEHLPMKEKKLYDPIIRAKFWFDAASLDNT